MHHSKNVSSTFGAIAFGTLGMALYALTAIGVPRQGERVYVCKARSLSGRYFSATGPDSVLAQDEAMRLCSAHSLRCYATGCGSSN